ncbi:homeobox-DDT domain protein RLT3-like isoform X2 [Hibiscus syriacus]|uniref:homeobox-DDT domain protein RLT3-like isoform X2 n=1 Tax=Hibiscus syriacus TaxID=106335 RepID=UPI0019215FF2|nr:homeobox-DDT domain protein RLT3-like isoform X2 [Hibiscus syriacus]
MKRKSQLQLVELEDLYKEKIYPTQEEMEGYAVSLGLTLKQVLQWFIYKRKREKRTILSIHSMKKSSASIKWNVSGIFSASENHKSTSSVGANCFSKKKKKMLLPQDLLPALYVLKKVFRKDGPPLGVEFDSLPSQAFFHCKGPKESHPADQECRRGEAKRRKVLEFTGLDHQNDSNEKAPVKKHGIGKGLMTAWRVVNPEGGNIPTGVDFSNREIGAPPQISPTVRRQPPRNKRRQPIVSQMKQRSLKKLQEKKKSCLQVVADFVAAINENWLSQCHHIEQGGCTVIEEIIAFFPTMPQTSSARALWLVKLDEFIASYLKKVHSEKETGSGTSSDRRAPKE